MLYESISPESKNLKPNECHDQTIIYQLKGKFNHLVTQIHLTNLELLNYNNIILDVTDILLYDFEFLDEYEEMVLKISSKKNLKIKGLPILDKWPKGV